MTGLLKKLPFLILILSPFMGKSQYQPQFYLRATEAAERMKTQERLIANVIQKNLLQPLTTDTEESWQSAFNAMEVVNYHDAFTWQKMQHAMSSLAFQSITFQRYALEAAYAMYAGDFVHEVEALLRVTTDPKIFAMCAVYLMKSTGRHGEMILRQMRETFGDSAAAQPILSRLALHIHSAKDDQFKDVHDVLRTVLSKEFLPGQTVLFSFQRKNRDYPGLALVRKANGEFVKFADTIFYVRQLARGVADLPYFLTKGNTPQGLHRMFGFGVSQNPFIGPTANIQMGMPVELSKEKFFADKKFASGSWSRESYAALLPPKLRGYEPLYDSYFAGMAGRNEIIAHGTTLNPEYYKGAPFYPMTPTEGCLSTTEFWDGRVVFSDQARLINALLAAGGAYGYVLVLEIDDKPEAVKISDIVTYFR